MTRNSVLRDLLYPFTESNHPAGNRARIAEGNAVA